MKWNSNFFKKKSDSSSKSANYCHATKSQPFGVLALCDVALGEMLPLRRAKFIEKLPDGKSSTFGVGELVCQFQFIFIYNFYFWQF